MTLIELCESEKLLPRNCDAILDVDHMQLSLRRENTVQEQVLKSMLDFRQDAEALFRNLSHIRLQNAEQKQKLETNLSFLDMLRVGNTEQLNIRRRWKESDPVHSLAVPLGQDGDGFPVMLDIHQKAHGPHGLVAGMTGSGKSELLISYILAMAVNFRPDEVSFILIDFKGGGMASQFRDLPHMLGTITNIDRRLWQAPSQTWMATNCAAAFLPLKANWSTDSRTSSRRPGSCSSMQWISISIRSFTGRDAWHSLCRT